MLCVTEMGLRFRPVGLRFRPVGLRFRPQGLRSSVFVFGSSISTHPSLLGVPKTRGYPNCDTAILKIVEEKALGMRLGLPRPSPSTKIGKFCTPKRHKHVLKLLARLFPRNVIGSKYQRSIIKYLRPFLRGSFEI